MINFKLMGYRVRENRIKLHLTQENLAEKLGISVEYMSRIETGSCRASYALIEKMSQIFEIDESLLLFGKQEWNDETHKLLEKINHLSEKQKNVITELIDLFIDVR